MGNRNPRRDGVSHCLRSGLRAPSVTMQWTWMCWLRFYPHRKLDSDTGTDRLRVRADCEHHGVRLDCRARQHDSGDATVGAGKPLHFGTLDEPCARLHGGANECQGRGNLVERSLARSMGRDRWRRGESGFEPAYLVPFDQPDVMAPGDVLGGQALRLGRIPGTGERTVPIDRERTVQLPFQATVVRDGRVAKSCDVGGVAANNIDPREGPCRRARSRARSFDDRHRHACGGQMVGERCANDSSACDDDGRASGHGTTDSVSGAIRVHLSDT